MDSVVCVIDSCFQWEEVWRILSGVTGILIDRGRDDPAVCAVLQPTVSRSHSEVCQHMDTDVSKVIVEYILQKISFSPLWGPKMISLNYLTEGNLNHYVFTNQLVKFSFRK